MKTRKSSTVLCISMVIVLLAGLTGCQSSSPNALPQRTDGPHVALSRSTAAFAPYNEIPLSIKPSVKSYQIAADLRNITNRDRYKLSPQAENIMSKNGFVVVPSPYREFFSSYENNRYDFTPNFITTDAMLHNYHLYFDHLLRTLEKDKLRGELNTLTGLMLAESQKQYKSLKGTDWEKAATRNVAYFAVLLGFLIRRPRFLPTLARR